jgi:chromosomal replication initiator protein
MSSSPELWEQTLAALSSSIDEESFGAWIEPIRFENYNDGVLTLTVPSAFFCTWLQSNFQDQIEKDFGQLAGCEVAVRYRIESHEAGDGDDHRAPAPSPALRDGADRRLPGISRQSPPPRQGIVQRANLQLVPLNPNYTFENFVVGESNRFANAAAVAVADPQSRAYNPLFLYGGVGLGKTHLMHAIGLQMLSYGPHLNVLYVSSEVFMNAFIEAVQQKDISQFRDYFRTVDLLLIDDVQFFAGKERSQIEFFHTFNALFDEGKKIVISSDHPPKQLIELEERLRSRFEAGLIVDIQPPDLETRMAILRRKAQDLRLHLPNEVAIYIAERIKTNIRKLEGALKKIAAHFQVTQEPISIDSTRPLLSEFFAGDEPVRISVEKIQFAVCKFFDINIHELTGSNRSRKYTVPRHLAAYLTRELTGLSFPEIARKFGGRDHTSIMHSHRKVQQELTHDLNKQNLVKYMTKLIKDEPIPGQQE